MKNVIKLAQKKGKIFDRNVSEKEIDKTATINDGNKDGEDDDFTLEEANEKL